MTLAKACEYIDRRVTVGEDGCWWWTGKRINSGYGSVSFQGIKTTAHRFSYWVYHGSVRPDHHVHHKCNNRLCVNVDHLESLSIPDHIKTQCKSLQTHCIHGHEFSEKNTYRKVSNGTRVCRACAAIRQQKLRNLK